MKASATFKRLISIVLCMALFCTVFTACNKGDDMFPSISSDTANTDPSESAGETSITGSESEIRQLKVALPYSELTIQCLVAMMYSKNNGLWDSTETGLTIDTAFLSNVATNYVVTNIGSGNTGANLETIRNWKASNEMPDLFLAQDSESAWKAGFTASLNDSVSDNKYLNVQQIYSDALTADSDEGVFYGIPHYCSAQVLIGNPEFIPSKIGKLQTRNTTEELKKYLKSIKKEYSCTPLASGYELVPYLGSAFNNDKQTSYMVNAEYSKDKEASKHIVNNAISYVRDLYSSGLSQDLYSGADPVYSRKAALWVDSSANIKGWSDYYGEKLYFLHLPCKDVTNPGIPYLSTYSLCVAKESLNTDFAAEFAAFISYDPDALLLIYRLEEMTGFMPLTRNEAVWDLVSGDKLFGHMTSDFRQVMDNAVYCPESFDSKLYASTNEYMADHVRRNDDFDPEKCYG